MSAKVTHSAIESPLTTFTPSFELKEIQAGIGNFLRLVTEPMPARVNVFQTNKNFLKGSGQDFFSSLIRSYKILKNTAFEDFLNKEKGMTQTE